MKLPSGCQARQRSDQMICPRCGLLWDTNDPDPPKCMPVKQPVKPKNRKRAGY